MACWTVVQVRGASSFMSCHVMSCLPLTPFHSLPPSLATYPPPIRSVPYSLCFHISVPCSSSAYLPPTHSVPPSGYPSNSLPYFVPGSLTASTPPTHPLGLSLLISSHSFLHSLLVSTFHNSFLPSFLPSILLP